MNALVSTVNAVTMTSREIAELTGKDHRHVMRDVRTLQKQLGDMFEGSAQNWTHPQNGQRYEEFALAKNTCLTLLLGYDAVARMKVVKRWQELEAGAAPAMPLTYAQALRAHADAVEAKEFAEAQARIANAIKAEIGARREATAMNTASQAVKKANQLERELDKSKEYASVKRMEMLYHGTRFNWRLLKDASTEMGVPAIDVFDQNYGTVKAYHASVWMAAYAVSINPQEAA